MGRVLLRKIDGKIIEYQSENAPLGTLTDNAVRAGFLQEEIEEKYVTSEEYRILLDSQPNPPPPASTQLELDIAAISDPQLKSILDRLRKGILL